MANAQVNTKVSSDLARGELLAFASIFLLSLLFFRSLLAALLPPLLAGPAILITFFVLRIIAGFVDISVYALNFTTGMGLGLAIDYSLFMGAFATSDVVFVKELGLGAALAVLIDASIIRAFLVPSLMALLGSANWWAPRPLRRLHDRVGLREGGGVRPPRAVRSAGAN